MTAWRLAFRGLRGNPFRSLLMAGGILVAAAVMTAVALAVAGLNQAIERTAGRLGADVMVVPRGETVARQFNEALITGKPAIFYMDQAALRAVRAVPGVRAASAQTFTETLTNARCCSGKFFLVGFDPETDFTIGPWLAGGDPRALPADGNWMLVGDRILLKKGDQATFYGTTFTVAGVLETTNMGMDWSIFIPRKALRQMAIDAKTKAEAPLRVPDGAVTAIFIQADPGVDLIDLAERLEAASPGVQAVLASSVAGSVRRRISGATVALAGIVVALWLVALALNAVVFMQTVKERQGEIGLLMAKGADRRFIVGMLTRESALLALAASAAGVAFGASVIALFRDLIAKSFGVGDVLPTPGAGAALALALVLLVTASAVVSAVGPALLILRMDPYEAIRQGAAA